MQIQFGRNMSQVSKSFYGFSNDGSDPDHTEIIWKSHILSHHQTLFLILFLQPIKEQLESSRAPPNSKDETPFPSWTRGWEPFPGGLQSSTQQQMWDSITILDKGLRTTSLWSGQRGLPSPEPAPWGRSWDQREGMNGTGPWILFSSFKTDTCCHLVPITASVHWDLPTEAPRWKTEAEALCAWSRENVPSISKLQKHLCPTVSSRTAVKIYSVRLLSEFLTSQPEAGWSQGCQWVAAGSETDHSFQGLDEMWHTGVRGEPGALRAANFHQLINPFFPFNSINIYLLSMVWTNFTMDQNLSKGWSSKSQQLREK